MSTTDPAAADGATTDGEAPWPARRSGRSVLGNLSWFAAALVLPMLVFVAFLLWRFAEGERTRLEREATDIAAAIALSIDRELTGIISSLEVLSTSPYLRQGDFTAFRRQAEEVLDRLGVATVVTDLSGQQLVNLRVAPGQPLPRSRWTMTREDLASGKPFVSNLITGQVTGTRQFLVAKIVKENDAEAFVLMFSVGLDRLQRLLRDADIGPGYTASIVDRNGVIMARNTRAEEFVGREATADLRASTGGRRGTWEGSTADGIDVFGAYARSDLSNFRAAAGIRFSDLDRPLWRSLSLFLLLGAALAALSTLLGFVFARRIAGPIRVLSRQSAALGSGEPVVPIETGLTEVDRVGADLSDASGRLRERERDLREANEEIQRFAYIVSHDLRSPLVNIMGFTAEIEALREDLFGPRGPAGDGAAAPGHADLQRDFDEALGFIKTSIAKMERLIAAILGLSRQGRRDFHPERIDMADMVAGIAASLKHQAERAGAAVELSRLPPIESDRLAMEQVFSNLLDNAIKYLRRDVPGIVTVSGRIAGGNAVYEVRDNGRGIEPKDLDRVFDLFRRSGPQDRPGEGIGLAHVRALVRRLGGAIVLTSEPGRGSTFAVTLPRRWAGPRDREAA